MIKIVYKCGKHYSLCWQRRHLLYSNLLPINEFFFCTKYWLLSSLNFTRLNILRKVEKRRICKVVRFYGSLKTTRGVTFVIDYCFRLLRLTSPQLILTLKISSWEPSSRLQSNRWEILSSKASIAAPSIVLSWSHHRIPSSNFTLRILNNSFNKMLTLKDDLLGQKRQLLKFFNRCFFFNRPVRKSKSRQKRLTRSLTTWRKREDFS